MAASQSADLLPTPKKRKNKEIIIIIISLGVTKKNRNVVEGRPNSGKIISIVSLVINHLYFNQRRTYYSYKFNNNKSEGMERKSE